MEMNLSNESLSSDNQSSAVQVETLAVTSCSWDGAELPDYPIGRPQISVLRYTILPHKRLASHRHLIINCGMMLQGELTVVAKDGREHTFRTGDPLVEMYSTPHYGENRGDVPAILVVFYIGSPGMPLKTEI